jgi:hypothetical protein
VLHADRLDLAAIADRRADLVRRAGAGLLSVDEMTSGTFTITNLGLYRIDHFTPVVNPPQIAILGVGRMARRPPAAPDEVALGADHPAAFAHLRPPRRRRRSRRRVPAGPLRGPGARGRGTGVAGASGARL